MKLCFPVQKNEGLQSQVSEHFGSAPLFLLVDTETQQIEELANVSKRHGHGHGQGGCGLQLNADSLKIDALVLGGIGRGALAKLEKTGVSLYRAQGKTVSDNILCMADGRLPQMNVEGTCSGHQHGHGAGGGCRH